MIPMNSPMFNVINIIRNGGNPYALLSQMSQQNPQIGQALNMMSGKSSQQLQQMAMNMAKERGVDLDSLARSMGITIPNNR